MNIALRRAAAGAAACLLAFLTGCSEPQFPRDPENTLERVTDGRLRVGVTENPPHTRIDDDEVTGPEAELMQDFAQAIGAEVEWVQGSESQLVEGLDLGRVDVVIGGLEEDSPWQKEAALTRPYGTTTGPDGKERKLVLAARAGENAFLTRLERFLIDEGHEA